MDTSPHKSDFVNVNGIQLHYLDWGGSGDVLLFLAGMGCNAHVFDNLAPRFTDKFHVMALTRRGHGESDHPETGYDIDTLTEDIRQFLDALGIEKVVMAGHSMANVELSHFSALYPERVVKLIFLDAAYNRSSALYKTMVENSPWRKIQPPGLDVDYYIEEEYFTAMKRAYPSFTLIWTEAMAQQSLHEIIKTPEGKIADRMSDNISKAITKTLTGYVLEDSRIKVPSLAFFSLSKGLNTISDEWMTEEQRTQLRDYVETRENDWTRESIELFRQNVPHARIIEIPQGHHYCFIQQEELVYKEMRKFLIG
ncbi:MAG TPA: alpha/beta hydrolase [Anaerolineales bacterium]|nr:alpha/beta hydrolase [Anaerolineales bacterium]